MNGISAEREHRNSMRVVMARPVYVHGVSVTGEKVKVHGVTSNVSQGGLFLEASCGFRLGSMVFTVTKMLNGVQIAANGMVVRVENKEGDRAGLAVSFKQPRLIPAVSPHSPLM